MYNYIQHGILDNDNKQLYSWFVYLPYHTSYCYVRVYSYLHERVCYKTVCCVMRAAASHISCFRMFLGCIILSCTWCNLFSTVTCCAGLYLEKMIFTIEARCVVGYPIQVCEKAPCHVGTRTKLPTSAILRTWHVSLSGT